MGESRIGWSGAGRGKNTKINARLKPMEENLLKTQQANKSQSRSEDG